MTKRNEPCPCGSNIKYKKCCGNSQVEDSSFSAGLGQQEQIEKRSTNFYVQEQNKNNVILEESSRNQKSAQEYYSVGCSYVEKNMLREAVECFKKALSLQPAAEVYYNLATIQEKIGNLAGAIDSFRKALSLRPDLRVIHFHLGNLLLETDNFQESINCYNKAISEGHRHAEIYNNLGVALKGNGLLEEAADNFKKALSLKNDYDEAYVNLGVVLYGQSKLEEAIDCYRKALCINPSMPQANNLLGNYYYSTGNIAAALPFFEKAIQSKPDNVEAYNTLGIIHYSGERYEKAISCYKKALHYKPNSAMTNNNLGLAQEALGQYQAALDSYQKALDIQPRFADAWVNQGIVFKEIGRLDNALVCFGRALTIKPNHTEAWQILSILVKWRKTLPEKIGSDSDRKNILVNALVRNDITPQIFFQACFHELFREDILEGVHEFLASEENPESYLNFIMKSRLSHLLSEHLFLLMLRKTVFTDQLAEAFLTKLRRGLAMLLATKEMSEEFCEQMTPIVCAIAHQCFYNEYLYQTTKAEEGQLSEITSQFRDDNSITTSKSAICLALLACYAPLDTYDIGVNFDANPPTRESLEELIQIQIVEPRKERELSEQIKAFSEINDKTSQLVRQQYEENPYPRWTNLALFPPKPFIEYLIEIIQPNSPTKLIPIEQPEVLIAGCGTGRHAIESAAMYLNSSVVAVDLSRTSLSYASRKADELEIKNIEFLQGDILNLHKLNKTFDIIESCGVLHHMSDPKKGFRVLVDLLRPSGYMLISLYSEIARQPIVATREFIKSHGFEPTIQGIRECRQALFALPDKDEKKVLTTGIEFYTTSTIRDLIFHVQEHRFTLTEISKLLEEFDLEFLGFDLDIKRKKHYLQEYGDDPNSTSLTNWHQYEQMNPNTFNGMYELWLRKKPI